MPEEEPGTRTEANMPRKKTTKSDQLAPVEPAKPIETKAVVLKDAIRWVPEPGQPQHAEVTELGLELIRQLTARGHNRVSIAMHMGISGKTFNQCVKRQPEVEQALEVGKAILDHDIHDALYQQGKAGYAPALMFLAKCRLGWRETDVPETKPNVQVLVVGPQSMDDWRASFQSYKQVSQGKTDGSDE